MRKRLALPFLLFATPAWADCPVQDKAALDAERAPLFAELKAAPTEVAGREIAGKIWQSWSTAPDPMAQDFLDRGSQRIAWSDFDEAERLLSELVAYCPDFPEGWNQRAFARYLAGDLDGALADIERTLALEPRHFGALAGKALTLFRMGEDALGHLALSEAVAIHPWLSERHLLNRQPGEKI